VIYFKGIVEVKAKAKVEAEVKKSIFLK